MGRKTIKILWVIIASIFWGLSLTLSTDAIADCPGGGSPQQEELGKLLLKTKYNGISCGYLGQPYNWMGNQAHPGIDYNAPGGTVVYAPVSGEYKLSSTEVLGKASYVILPNGKRLFLLHMKDLILGHREKGDKIGLIYDDHVHAELRAGYSGTYLVGGVTCGGTCTLEKIEELTDDPSEVASCDDLGFGFCSWEDHNLFFECMDTGYSCDKSDVDHIVSHEFVRRIVEGQFDQATKDRIINYVELLYGREFIKNALTACSNCAIEIENENFTYLDYFEYFEYLEDYTPVSAISDLESLFKYIKVSDAGKDMWEESVELEPGEKYDVKAKFHTYTGSTEIGGDIKFYLSDDKHFDTDEDEYLGKDTFTLRPGEDEKEYWKGEHAPDEEGNYYIFCRVKWDDDNRFYSEEYAKIKVRIPNYKPEGYLDSVSCDMIAGWARDSNTTDPISIHVYADGPAESGFFVGSTVANSYRGDLPYTDKNHGFSFAIPNSLKDNQIHSIYVYAIDSEGGENPLLNNCPQNLKCVPVVAIMSIIKGIILAEDTIITDPPEPDPENLIGDLNGDNMVTLSDAILALQVSCGMSFSVKAEADVNNDGKIGMSEAIYILQIM